MASATGKMRLRSQSLANYALSRYAFPGTFKWKIGLIGRKPTAKHSVRDKERNSRQKISVEAMWGLEGASNTKLAIPRQSGQLATLAIGASGM
jgi:hypothetical protein